MFWGLLACYLWKHFSCYLVLAQIPSNPYLLTLTFKNFKPREYNTFSSHQGCGQGEGWSGPDPANLWPSHFPASHSPSPPLVVPFPSHLKAPLSPLEPEFKTSPGFYLGPSLGPLHTHTGLTLCAVIISTLDMNVRSTSPTLKHVSSHFRVTLGYI